MKIIMQSDKRLRVESGIISEGENYADSITIIVPRSYQQHDLSTFVANIIFERGKDFLNIAEIQTSNISENTITYTYSLTNIVTGTDGYYILWLHFLKENILIKTSSITFRIFNKTNVSSTLTGTQLELLEQWESRMLSMCDDANSAIMMSESYACGGTNIRDGEEIDNAKYYSAQALEANDQARSSANVSVEQATLSTANANTAINQATISTQSASSSAQSAFEAMNNKLNGISTHNNDLTAHQAIQTDIRTVEAIARGKARAFTFDTYDSMETWLLNEANTNQLQKGDNLYIKYIGVPDYWWDGTWAQELEAENPDLINYPTKIEMYANLPLPIEQSDYDSLISAGTVQAGRIYYVVPNGALSSSSGGGDTSD